MDNKIWSEWIESVEKNSPRDKILGMIYGHALGDAVGLQNGFKRMTGEEVKFPYHEQVGTAVPGDWGADTDNLILVMQSMMEDEFNFNEKSIAERLRFWLKNGFKDISNERGEGNPLTNKAIVGNKNYINDPSGTASDYWERAGRQLANNGSLMRTSIVGALADKEFCEKYACGLSEITHVDRRCVIGCVFQSLLINNLIYGKVNSSKDVNEIMANLISRSRAYYMNEDPKLAKQYDNEFSYWIKTGLMRTKTLSELNLGKTPRIDYVFKTLACSIWVMKIIMASLEKTDSIPDFEKIIKLIVGQYGDSNTNAAVAGATLGAYIGYKELPEHWLEVLPNRRWLNKQTSVFIDMLTEYGLGGELPEDTPDELFADDAKDSDGDSDDDSADTPKDNTGGTSNISSDTQPLDSEKQSAPQYTLDSDSEN